MAKTKLTTKKKPPAVPPGQRQESLLARQRAALQTLKERGFTSEDIAPLVGATARAVRTWIDEGRRTKPKTIDRLEELASGNYQPGEERPIEGRGNITQEEKRRRDELVAKLGLKTPKKRVAKLRQIIKESRMKRDDFARELGVASRTLYLWLDSNYDGTLSLAAAEKLNELVTERKRDTTVSLEERFDRAKKKLLSPDIYEEGFKRPDRRRARLLEVLIEFTGLSYRTFYRLFPTAPEAGRGAAKPRKGRKTASEIKLTEGVVEALERAAEELGRVV